MEASDWLEELRKHELREETRLDSLHEMVTKHDGMPEQLRDLARRVSAMEQQLANLNVGVRFLIWLGGAVTAAWVGIERMYDHVKITFH